MPVSKKRKEFLKRSRAAKKGWKTRRKRYGPSGRKPKPPIDIPVIPEPDQGEGVELELGYDGSKENSYSMRVVINTHKPIQNYSPDQLADLIQDLAQNGHFDNSENNPNYDLRWVDFNSYHIVSTGLKVKKGEAYLNGFARVAPGIV